MNRVTIFRIAVIVIGSIILIFATMKQNQSTKVLEPKTNFEVVDNYKGRCDVVSWTNNQLAEYKYFLVCKDK
jgi:hypothetical protein